MATASARTPLHDWPRIPEDFADRYRRAGYWQDETFRDFFLDRTRRHAKSAAVVGRHELTAETPGSLQTTTWDYADLEREARRAVTTLREAGAAAGDRVVLQMPNTADYLAFMVGTFLLGTVPVFTLPKHRASEIEHFARRTDAAVHVVVQGAENFDYVGLHEEVAEALRADGLVPPTLVVAADTRAERNTGIPDGAVVHRADTEPAEELPARAQSPWAARASEDLAFLQLSGGTTGISKLIPRTHADYLYSVRESVEICGVDRETRMLVALPAAHNFTMSSPGILGVLHAGGTVVLAADPSPQTAFALISRDKVTMASLVPPLAQAWIASARRKPADLSSLQTLQIGGAKLAPSVAEQVRPVLDARLQQVFGMAEGLVNYTREEDPDRIVNTTQGRPISAADEILVVDDEDLPVEDGVPGHLLTRGPYTIRGYYLEKTANRHGFTDEGFYRTGDIVTRHPSGHLEVTGRAKDQINRAGEKIAVDEIEDLALAAPGVEDAVVIGIPDESVGERVGLIVVPDPAAGAEPFGPSPRQHFLDFFRNRNLAEFKIPERVEVLDSLPLTNVGKISRKELRLALADALGLR